MTPRLAAKKDANHDEICDAFRAIGWYVFETYQLGDGFPDAVCSRHWVNLYVEIKSARGSLTEKEQMFWNECPGPKEIVRTLDDVLKVNEKYRD